MSDRYNSDRDPQIDLDWDADRTQSSIYDEGLKYFKASNFFLERDIDGEHCFHKIYIVSDPPVIKGINYPSSFKVLLPLTEAHDIERLQRLVLDKKESDSDFHKFWQPLSEPDITNRKPIYSHVSNLIRADIEGRKVRSGQPFDLGIATYPEPGQLPKKWIPREEWFSESLKGVEMSDVFTIFPEAERDILELILGRLCVGRNNNVQASGDTVRHTSRMAAIVVGFDPGTGKSTLFTYLQDAIGKCGYRTSTFRSLSDRFNLGQSIKSDMLYKDDVSNDSFKKFLKSESAKIIITGGTLRCEQKGIDAVDESAHATVIVNTNSYDPRSIFEIDPGTADRIKLLQTYSEGEIRRMALEGPSKGSPNAKPFNHLPWLAEKLDVSIDALLLYVCRQAADKFWKIIHTESHEVNHLEVTVRDLSGQLRLLLSKDSTKQVLMYLFFCHMLCGRIPMSVSRTKLTSLNWAEAFQSTLAFVKSRERDIVESRLRDHWLKHNRPASHPYPGFMHLNHSSLKPALVIWHETSFKSLAVNMSERYRKVFGAIHLKSGFRLGCDLVWMVREWELSGAHFESLKDLVLECRDEIHQRDEYALDNLSKSCSGVEEYDHE